MIVLDATTKLLQVVLSGAVTTNHLEFTASYADYLASPASFTPGDNNGLTNNTTAVTLVAAPAASTQRQVKRINVYNSDTASATVTIRLSDAGNFRTQRSVTLLPGEYIEYEDAHGFTVYDASGAAKTAQTIFQAGTYILAQLLSDQNFAAGAFATCIFGNEVSDALGEYNPATGEVTIKNTGRYLIAAYCQLASAADTSALVTSVFRNGVDFMRVGSQNASNPGAAPNQSAQVGGATFANLTVGDVITIRGYIDTQVAGGTTRFVGGAPLTNFSMMRVG